MHCVKSTVVILVVTCIGLDRINAISVSSNQTEGNNEFMVWNLIGQALARNQNSTNILGRTFSRQFSGPHPNYPYQNNPIGYPQHPNGGFQPYPNGGYQPYPNGGYPPQPNSGYPQHQNGGYPPYPNGGFPHFPRPHLQGITQSFAEAFEQIARNDEFQCVPRLLCELVSEPTAIGMKRQIDTSGLFPSFNLNMDSLLSMLSSFNGQFASPVLRFAVAAVQGYTHRKNSEYCYQSYPRCPRNPDDLVDYLNNYNGGFFRYFAGLQPNRPNPGFGPGQNYPNQYPHSPNGPYPGSPYAQNYPHPGPNSQQPGYFTPQNAQQNGYPAQLGYPHQNQQRPYPPQHNYPSSPHQYPYPGQYNGPPYAQGYPYPNPYGSDFSQQQGYPSQQGYQSPQGNYRPYQNTQQYNPYNRKNPHPNSLEYANKDYTKQSYNQYKSTLLTPNKAEQRIQNTPSIYEQPSNSLYFNENPINSLRFPYVDDLTRSPLSQFTREQILTDPQIREILIREILAKEPLANTDFKRGSRDFKFPDRENDDTRFRGDNQLRDLPIRQSKGLRFEDSSSNIFFNLKPNYHKTRGVSVAYPDRTGTGELVIDL